jgi:hypothetical protein
VSGDFSRSGGGGFGSSGAGVGGAATASGGSARAGRSSRRLPSAAGSSNTTVSCCGLGAVLGAAAHPNSERVYRPPPPTRARCTTAETPTATNMCRLRRNMIQRAVPAGPFPSHHLSAWRSAVPTADRQLYRLTRPPTAPPPGRSWQSGAPSRAAGSGPPPPKCSLRTMPPAPWA